MGGFSVPTILGLGGFAVGLVFGGVVQRTNFCTMGGISDLVLMGDGRRFRAWLLAIAVAIIGTQALSFAGVIDINKSIYLTPNLGWLGAIIGGAMFGFGMTQTGGCASKTLVRLGSGNLKSLVAMVVLGIVAYMTLRGLLALPRLQIETTNVDLTARGLHSQNLGEMVGMALGVPAAYARAGVAAVVALLFLAICFKDADFRRSPANIIAGVVIGLTAIGGWLVTGVLAKDEFNPVQLSSITFVAPAGDSLAIPDDVHRFDDQFRHRHDRRRYRRQLPDGDRQRHLCRRALHRPRRSHPPHRRRHADGGGRRAGARLHHRAGHHRHVDAGARQPDRLAVDHRRRLCRHPLP